jgi:hypothetical protein
MIERGEVISIQNAESARGSVHDENDIHGLFHVKESFIFHKHFL